MSRNLGGRVGGGGGGGDNVCKFFLNGNCKFGNNCRFVHPRDKDPNRNAFSSLSGQPNRGSAAGSGLSSRGGERDQNTYGITEDGIKLDLTAERPIWPFSCFGPGKNAPREIIGPDKEYSAEEMRLLYYVNPPEGQQKHTALQQSVEQQVQTILRDLRGAVRFVLEADNSKDPNVNRLVAQQTQGPAPGGPPATPMSVTSPSPFGQASQPASQGAFGQPSQLGSQSAFGQPSQPGGQSAFGQPSQPGRTSAFGQPSQLGGPSAFGQPSQAGGASAFGQPSQLGAAGGFGQPSQLGSSTAFGQPSQLRGSSSLAQSSQAAGPSAFGAPSQTGGQSAFGRPSKLGAPAFGQPTQANAPSPFAQPSPDNTQPAFGQPSQPVTQSGAFGQPSPLGGSSNAFGQPSQVGGQSSFGNPSPFAAAASSTSGPSPFAAAAQKQEPEPSPFAQSSASTSSPFGQPLQQGTPQQQPAFGSVSAFGQPSQQPNPQILGAIPSQQSQQQQSGGFGTNQQNQPQLNGFGSRPMTTSQTQGGNNTALGGAPTQPAYESYAQKSAGGNLSNWKGQPVQFLEVLKISDKQPDEDDAKRAPAPDQVKYAPFYQRPDERDEERIWFPDGPQWTDKLKVDAEAANKSVYAGELGRVLEDIYNTAASTGSFKDGVMPEVPPQLDWVRFDI